MPAGVTALHECEQCGETENVKKFVHFDNTDDEYLCWDCREPIIKERVATDDADEDEPSGQTGLGDFT